MVIAPTASRANTPPDKINLAIGYPQICPDVTSHCDMANQPGAMTDVTPMSYQRHGRMRASGPGWWRAFPRAPRLAGVVSVKIEAGSPPREPGPDFGPH